MLRLMKFGKSSLPCVRQKAGYTQEQVAEKLHTSKSNISRLESVNSNISPRLSTITDYAEAMGYKLKIDFVPSKRIVVPRQSKE